MSSHFLRYKFTADFNSSVLSQGALEIYLKNGMFQSHIKKIKELYFGKMKLLQEACELFLPNNTLYTKPASGFYLTIYLPEHVAARQIVQLLKEQRILIDDASRMFLPEYKKENLIRLSISQVEDNQIHTGVEKLAHCITLIDSKRSATSQYKIQLL